MRESTSPLSRALLVAILLLAAPSLLGACASADLQSGVQDQGDASGDDGRRDLRPGDDTSADLPGADVADLADLAGDPPPEDGAGEDGGEDLDPDSADGGDPDAAVDARRDADGATSDDPDATGGDDPDAASTDDPDAAGTDDPDAGGADDPDSSTSDDPDATGGDDPDATGGDEPDAFGDEPDAFGDEPDVFGDEPDVFGFDLVPPSPCRADRHCRSGLQSACVLLGESVSGYSTSCRSPGGSEGAGAICADGSECRGGRCQDGLFCAAPCANDGDCAAGTCRPFELLRNDRGTPDDVADDLVDAVDLCVPSDVGSLDRCVTSADCPGAEVCSLFNDETEGLERRCVTPSGAQERGECDAGADCATFACLSSNYCFWTCLDESDCDESSACISLNFTDGGGGTTVIPACAPTCVSDLDCGGGESCQWFTSAYEPDEITLLCDPSVGAKASGAVCATGSECRSGACGSNGRCIGPCDEATDDDCAAGTFCYPDLIYLTFDQGTATTDDDRYEAFSTCLPDIGSYQTCTRDADCPGSEVCAPQPNATLTALDRRCVDPIGVGTGGAACTTASQCATGVCLGGGSCLGFCQTGTAAIDCGGGTCSEYELTLDFFGTDDVTSDDIVENVFLCD